MKTLSLLLMVFFSQLLAAAEHQILVYENRFSPEVLSVNSGDSVEWKIVSGNHQIMATDNGQGIEFTSPVLSPDDPFTSIITGFGGEVFYSSSATVNMQGALVVKSAPSSFVIDEKINAGFHNPDTPGQGLLFHYVPASELLIAYWFTYSKAADSQLWLIASGTVTGNRANLTVLKPVGGQINDPQATSQQPWGEMTVEFTDCYQATVYYNAQQDQHSGQFPVQRLYLAAPCESGGTP